VSSNSTGSSISTSSVTLRPLVTPSKAKLSKLKSIGSSTTHHQTRGSSISTSSDTLRPLPPLKGSRV
jgi:hypothetical protein